MALRPQGYGRRPSLNFIERRNECRTTPLTHLRHWRISYCYMRFVETPIFTRQVTTLLSDDEYKALQQALLLRPEQGALIRGSGGLRKVRWTKRGIGKRGGIRVIYYWNEGDAAFFMLFAYGKNVKDDLTQAQLKVLRRIVREEFE